MELEQKEAQLLRTLYRLKLIDFYTLDKLIDKLQIRLWTRTLKDKTDPKKP